MILREVSNISPTSPFRAQPIHERSPSLPRGLPRGQPWGPAARTVDNCVAYHHSVCNSHRLCPPNHSPRRSVCDSSRFRPRIGPPHRSVCDECLFCPRIARRKASSYPREGEESPPCSSPQSEREITVSHTTIPSAIRAAFAPRITLRVVPCVIRTVFAPGSDLRIVPCAFRVRFESFRPRIGPPRRSVCDECLFCPRIARRKASSYPREGEESPPCSSPQPEREITASARPEQSEKCVYLTETLPVKPTKEPHKKPQ